MYMAVVQCDECVVCFFFQAEDGIRDLVRSRGLGDVYKRQPVNTSATSPRRIAEVQSRYGVGCFTIHKVIHMIKT